MKCFTFLPGLTFRGGILILVIESAQQAFNAFRLPKIRRILAHGAWLADLFRSAVGARLARTLATEPHVMYQHCGFLALWL